MTSRVSTRTLVVVGILVSLLLAGLVSSLASSSPDGLNKAAQEQGFADQQTRRPVGGGKPLAGYQTPGVANEDASGGAAGLAGCAMVLVLMSGLVIVVRRRRTIGTEA